MADRGNYINNALMGLKDHLGDESEYSHMVWMTGGSINLEAGDIQIGAVEIKDHDSDIRLDVETVTLKNAAYTQSEAGGHPDLASVKTAIELIDHLTAANSGSKDANTQRVTVATDDINLAAINAVSGATSGAAVVTDAAGTIQQYLRGLVKLIAAKVGVTVADGDDIAQGTTTDAAASSSAAETATARTGISLWKGIKNILILMNAKWAALGQAAMAASMPVAIASDQSNVPVAEAPVACAAADVHAPAANTAAVVTYAGSAGLKHVITGIAWSYHGGIPTNGNLIIEDVSGTTVYNIDIHEEGPGDEHFPKPKKSAAVNTAMIITLAAGGVGITGKVSCLNHFTEA